MHFGTRLDRVLAASLVLAAITGCTAGAKKEVAKTALDSMSTADRQETFEATARILDTRPDLVDELYVIVRKHPPAMNRFMASATRDMHEPELAKLAAELLAQHPASVEETTLQATSAIAKSKEARPAMTRAVAKRANESVDLLTDDPKAMSGVVAAMLNAVEKKPAARKSVLGAIRENRGRMVALIKNDPELAKEVAEELVRAAVDDVKKGKP